MGIILFFLVTGLLNFAAGFALAMMLDLGPRSWRDVTAWIAARRPASENGP